MENKNIINSDFMKIIESNPKKKFILYLRTHPDDENEQNVNAELVSLFGKCKELPEEKLVIFIVIGDKVKEFINKLNSYKTQMYISFIQSEDELKNSF